MLTPFPERGDPQKLRVNASCSLQGWSTTLDLEWSSVPLPGYQPALGGKEVNTSPTQSPHRYAKIVRHKPGLTAALAPFSRCLVTARVTKHLCFSFQPTDRIFSEVLYVFPLDKHTAFAVLQSRIHEHWTRLLSSSLGQTLRYAASDCFDTFPFPQPDPRAALPDLEKAGEKLYVARSEFMLETQQGLTKTYNALKGASCTDRAVLKLRELHEDMDAAVLAAYDWDDLTVPPYCARSDVEKREQGRFALAVIDRLYALNGVRACSGS